jgi:hypothetical protein
MLVKGRKLKFLMPLVSHVILFVEIYLYLVYKMLLILLLMWKTNISEVSLKKKNSVNK